MNGTFGDRMGNHKEDSTRGTSVLSPVSYKGDALVQAWIDSRVLATLSRWLDREGNFTRFLSEVVKDSLQMLCDHLVNNNEIEMVDDTVEARTLLERKYRVNLNPNDRGNKNKLHNVILSNKRRSLRGRIDSHRAVVTESDPANKMYGKRFTEEEAKALMYSDEVNEKMAELHDEDKCMITDEEWEKAQKRIKEEGEKDHKKEEEGWKERTMKAVQAAKDRGVLAEDGSEGQSDLSHVSQGQDQSAVVQDKEDVEAEMVWDESVSPLPDQKKALEALDKMTASVGDIKLKKLSEEEIVKKEEEVERRDREYLKELGAPVNLEELMKGAVHKRI